MLLGLSFLPDASPGIKSAAAWHADALALSELADQAGLQAVKMTEHYLNPYGGYCPSPLAFLAAVAARTKHIRLLTGCVLPTFHHPIQTASEAAMVDAISGGRLEVGFARGYLPYEFSAFGISMDESRDRFEQSIKAIIRLWTEEHVSFHSNFFSFHDVTCLPRPVQVPHPPVWGAAVKSRQSFAWLGENGFNLMVTLSFTPYEKLKGYIDIYRESFRIAHGNSGRQSRVALSLPVYVAETDAEALEQGRFFLQRSLDVWASAAASWDRNDSRDYLGYRGLAQVIRSQTPLQLCSTRHVLMGCPARVADDLVALQGQLGVDEILCQLDFGAMPLENAQRTLRLLTDQVRVRI